MPVNTNLSKKIPITSLLCLILGIASLFFINFYIGFIYLAGNLYGPENILFFLPYLFQLIAGSLAILLGIETFYLLRRSAEKHIGKAKAIIGIILGTLGTVISLAILIN